jgi:eukaryotic translation initiation factor 2C
MLADSLTLGHSADSQDVISEMLGSGGGGGRGGRGGFRGGPGRGGAPGGHGGAGLRELSPIEQRKVLGVLRMAKFKVTHR